MNLPIRFNRLARLYCGTAIVALAALATGCSRASEIELPAQAPMPRGEYTIIASAPWNEGTRSSQGDWTVSELTDDPQDSRITLDGLQMKWQEGDQIGVFCSTSTEPLVFTFDHTSANQDTFTGPALTDGVTYVAYYPYNEALVYDKTYHYATQAITPTGNTGYKGQFQDKSGSMDNLSRLAFLYSSPFVANGSSLKSGIKFHHAYSVVKVTLTAKNYHSGGYLQTSIDNTSLTRIDLVDDVNSFGYQTRLYANGDFTYLSSSPYKISRIQTPSNKKHLFYQDGETYVAYLLVNNFTESLSNLKLRVYCNHAIQTDGSQYVEIPLGKPDDGWFVPSKFYTITRTVDFDRYYSDMRAYRLQEATKGGGVNLILMGDGYTQTDMHATHGKYATDMREAMEHFFSAYPISEFRDYFNVWMIAAISEEQGMSCRNPERTVNTAFSSTWDGAGSTGITCDDGKVQAYLTAQRDLLPGMTIETINQNRVLSCPYTVIMPINYDTYAGTCIMWGGSDTYMSVAMVPRNTTTSPNTSYKATLIHEACGHGFAKLADEYVYYPSSPLPQSVSDSYTKDQVTQWKDMGCYENVDLHGDISQTTWAGFAANRAKYPATVVNTFEGACTYGQEVWRPEYNSCMNDNVQYFNAPSRYAMVRRIMKISGENTNYPLADFMAWDNPPVASQSAGAPLFGAPAPGFIPLAPPILRVVDEK